MFLIEKLLYLHCQILFADNFAVQQGHAEALKEALVILDNKNRSSTNVDSWYSAYHHSHPPLVQRLGAIEEAQKKKQ